MRQLEAIVLKPLKLLLVRKSGICGASRPEQETLQTKEHPSALERLGLTRLVKHILKSLSVGTLKDILGAVINLFLELFFVQLPELRDFFVNAVEVDASQLFVCHDLLLALLLYSITALLGKLCS